MQSHLYENPEACQLLEQLQDLHCRSQEALAEALQDRGRCAQDIIDSAMQQTQGSGRVRHRTKWAYSQFAAGLAAGLLISAGALLLFGPHMQTPPVGTTGQPSKPPSVLDTGQASKAADWTRQNPFMQRNVDWIMFTDPQGEHYLIEGLREARRVHPAVYQGDF